MSYGAEYTARFAPIDEWHTVNLMRERFSEAAFENQGLSKYPEICRKIPIALRHEKTKTAGAIERLWVDDGWWCARFKLDPSKLHSCVAADSLEIGSPVSVSFLPVDDTVDGYSRLYRRVWMTELSVLMWGQRPAYDGARVVAIREPPAMTKAEVEALTERARNLPPLTDISVLDRPSRRPDDADVDPDEAHWRLYAEQRAREGVLVRYGIGQVLGVR
jgi:hypothetical protein